MFSSSTRPFLGDFSASTEAPETSDAEARLTTRTLYTGAALISVGTLIGALGARSFRGALWGAAAGSISTAVAAHAGFISETIALPGGAITITSRKLVIPFAAGAGAAALAAWFLRKRRRS